MRGFLVGTLTLVVLGVLLDQGPSSRLAGAAGWAEKATRRLLSPDVAGIPDRRGGKGRTSSASKTTKSSPTRSV